MKDVFGITYPHIQFPRPNNLGQTFKIKESNISCAVTPSRKEGVNYMVP